MPSFKVAILGRAMTVPRSILSRELLPASVAIFTTVAIVAFERPGGDRGPARPHRRAGAGASPALGDHRLLLASGVTTAIAGSFIDSVGTSTVFRWATLAFAASSLAAAAAGRCRCSWPPGFSRGLPGGRSSRSASALSPSSIRGHLVGRAFAANSSVWGILGIAGPAMRGPAPDRLLAVDLPAHGPDFCGGADRRLADVARSHRVQPTPGRLGGRRAPRCHIRRPVGGGLEFLSFSLLFALVSSCLGPCCGGEWPGPFEPARPAVRRGVPTASSPRSCR